MRIVEFVQAWWPVLTTLLLPFVVAVIARCSWSSTAKRYTAIALSALVGILAVFNAGVTVSPENLATIVLVCVGGMQTAYTLLKSNGVTSDWLDKLLELGSPRIE